ncbi:MAG: helix-turn-helix domain-containing protein [Bacteroidaceae bacterium]|nr:helix-turn-helix domain-containing protein [Bacteroidaceae bacterium]
MNNHYFEKLSKQGFSTITSALQQFIRHSYTLQFTTFFWCQGGEAIFTIDGHRFRFVQGSTIICPKGSNITVHDITSDFSTRFLGVSEDIWLAARCSFSPEMIQAITCRPYKGLGTSNEQAFISNIFKQVEIIEDELRYIPQESDYCRKNIILLANALLLYVQHAQEAASNEQIKKDLGIEDKEKFFLQFRDLITQHFREERSVQFYADKLNISTRYLNSVCQRAAEQNAKNIIDRYTIVELQVALMYTHKTFQELVNEYHFPDQSYLNRYFKRHTGYSLSEFRSRRALAATI